MKKLIPLFCLVAFLLSCQPNKRGTTLFASDEEEFIDTFPTATTIVWVDKDKEKLTSQKKKGLLVRTVKAQVDIDSAGRIKILSYVKKPNNDVHHYLKQKLEVFRITRVMLDSGYVRPGTQYIQLRYTPARMAEYFK